MSASDKDSPKKIPLRNEVMKFMGRDFYVAVDGTKESMNVIYYRWFDSLIFKDSFKDDNEDVNNGK